MTEQLKEHLARCEEAMQAAKPILGKHAFPTDPRTLTVLGFISVLVEHQITPVKWAFVSAAHMPVKGGIKGDHWGGAKGSR